MKYANLLKTLYSVNMHSGMKFGLDNSLALNFALQSPINKFSSIHVAGTNGKGSVTTKIASGLQASGLRVGLYTSPHIACFRERIRINGEMISEESVVRHLSLVMDLAEKTHIPATFFELATLAAFSFFAEEQVDIAVVETGLGGRLDATNIILPKLSVITSISLEHTDVLGKTIEEIALEKAGIIKPSIPVIIGPRTPVQFMQKIAEKRGSPCIVIDGLFQDFHVENKAIAAAALKFLCVPPTAIRSGLDALPPCRMEIWSNEALKNLLKMPVPEAIVLDVAHNPDGIQALLKALRQRFPDKPFRFIAGMSKNKDIRYCLHLLESEGEHIHLVQGSNERAADAATLADALITQGCDPHKISIEPSIPKAITHAFAKAQSQSQIVIACGTFFIMGEVRAALGIQEPRDDFLVS